MEFEDREELAAAFAGLHNLFGVLVKKFKKLPFFGHKASEHKFIS